MAFGGYAFGEPWTTGVTHYKISPPRWPAGLSLRLAIIADLHVCEPWMGMDRVRSVVEHTNALAPDCVLLLGDYVSGLKMSRLSERVPHKVWAKALGKLRAPYGVHSVLGNHDWWEDAKQVQRGDQLPRAGLALQDAGIAVFENASVRLTKDGHGFWIAGLGDQWAFMGADKNWRSERGLQMGTDDLKGTLASVTDDAPVVLDGARARYICADVRPRGADSLRPHAWWTGARDGLRALRAIAFRQPLRLWPYYRERAPSRRFWRPWLQRGAGSRGLPAGNRDNRPFRLIRWLYGPVTTATRCALFAR